MKVLKEFITESKLNVKLNYISAETKVIFCEGFNETYLNQIVKKRRKICPSASIVIHHGFSHPNQLTNKNILKEIDLILVPSEWVKDLFFTQENSLLKKTIPFPMPCSIEKRSLKSKKLDKIVIYNKENGFIPKADYSVFIKKIMELSKKLGISTECINYGRYKKLDYLNLLDESKYLVYLSQQETQGLALMQAWQKDTATLIYDRGIAEWDDVNCKGSSAPYFSNKVGCKFESIDDLEEKFKTLLSTQYNPSEYYYKNFSKDVVFEKLDILLSNLIK